MRAHFSLRVLAVLGVGVALIGAGSAYYMNSVASGTLVVQVRDVPSQWRALTLRFSEVSVHPAGAAGGWVSLSLASSTVDFLALGNATQVLAQGSLSPQTYDQVRLQVTSANGVLSTGTLVAIQIPNGTLLTETAVVVRGGGTTTVTLDFDLASSVSNVGGMWVFTPVLRPSVAP